MSTGNCPAEFDLQNKNTLAIRRHQWAILISIATAIPLISIAYFLISLLEARNLHQHQIDLGHRLSVLRTSIEARINRTIFVASGLGTYVTSNPDLGQTSFERVARAILAERSDFVRNVGLIRDGELRYLYPVEGNEKALGLRIAAISAQRDAFERSIAERKTVVAGPVDLMQGGRGIISRTPIFLPKSDGSRTRGEFWGLASIVVDADAVFRAAGFASQDDTFRFALQGKDGLGEAGEIFQGDPRVLEHDPLSKEIVLPEGRWQLLGSPINSWEQLSSASLWIKACALAVALAFNGLIFLLAKQRNETRFMALHDPLTHLANRRLLIDRVDQALARRKRSGGYNVLMVLDLDDFKVINDHNGHEAGDLVLCSVSRRLLECVRETDTVARTGGDEFVIFLEGVADLSCLSRIVNQILEKIDEPIRLNGKRTVQVHMSIGVALNPIHGANLDELTRHADQALYVAKHRGKGDYQLAPGVTLTEHRRRHGDGLQAEQATASPGRAAPHPLTRPE